MWLIGLALGQQAECLSCCVDAGAPCEATLRVVAEDHQLTGAGVNGTWVVSCDGSAVFDPVGDFPVSAPIPGEVVTDGISPAQLRCFAENCSFPEDLCPQAHQGRPVLRHCDTDAPFVDLDLAPEQIRPYLRRVPHEPEEMPSGQCQASIFRDLLLLDRLHQDTRDDV